MPPPTRKRSCPRGRNTRGRHRSDAVLREAATFRRFSLPCLRSHPPEPERLPPPFDPVNAVLKRLRARDFEINWYLYDARPL